MTTSSDSEATLHLVGGSADAANLAACLATALPGDIVVLTGDAVLTPATSEGRARLATAPAGIQLLALARDADERGMSTRLANRFVLIDDHELVRRCVTCARSVSWF